MKYPDLAANVILAASRAGLFQAMRLAGLPLPEAEAAEVAQALARTQTWRAELDAAACITGEPPGIARVFIVRASWVSLRRALPPEPEAFIVPRCPPHRPLQSVVFVSWGRALLECPALPDPQGALRTAVVQRAAHEAAADVLREYGLVCYVAVEVGREPTAEGEKTCQE